ncbi:MAG: aldo/keto reductase [Succinatimonas sp.]|nr:aldo/keto reductase [Succinatimonas sp.]
MDTYYTLKNGKKIPSIGYGTFKITDKEECINSVKNAIDLGYTHIDTAKAYNNEELVGQGIRESGIKREDLFLTTKVWNTDRGYDKTLKAFDSSLKKLGVDYIDLYLIHWPAVVAKYPDYKELNKSSWKALEHLYKEGKVKSIGVSNFTCEHLKPLLDSEIPPMVNQIEFHPGYMQKEVLKLSQDNGIVVEAWSPLGRGALMNAEIILKMAQKYNTTAANICISFCFAHKVLPLVKSSHKERMQSNLDAYKINLEPADLEILNNIGDNLGWSGLDPEKFAFA